MSYAIEQPQNARSVRTRKAILDAAWRLFEEQGPEATTVAAVAETAGVSVRGLYLHFPSRTDLLIATVVHADQRLGLEDSLRPVREAPDAVTALSEWTRHVVDYHSQIRHLLDACDRARVTDEDVQTLWQTAMGFWRRDCRTVIDRLAQEGKLAAKWTVADGCDALWALMLGFNRMYPALTDDRDWSHEQFRDFLSRLHHDTFVG